EQQPILDQETMTRQANLRQYVVSGSTGLVGKRLCAALSASGCRVDRLVRSPPTGQVGEIVWDPLAGSIDAASLEGCDAVIHLAGESIAAGRWTRAKKERILASRVDGTRLLCQTLASLKYKPSVLVSASAIGYYGNHSGEALTEDGPLGQGFLAEVCRAWERATEPAEAAGIRVVHLRTGMVLAAEGGALAKMLLPFKLGAGGVVGSGRQIMSWIGLTDLVAAIKHVVQHESIRGPVNAVAPNPVTNRQFTKTLGSVLRRPTIFPLPGLVVRLLFGEMGQSLLLEGCPVSPRKLLDTGFRFEYPGLESALRAELGR
ncbi:MAG: TIGR01777 family oxidoreductase, partial [Phycisphaerae bacterium]